MAATHVHFIKEDSADRFQCWRGGPLRPLGDLEGNDDLITALVGGLPACKRCMRALPRDVRVEVLRLSEEAGV